MESMKGNKKSLQQHSRCFKLDQNHAQILIELDSETKTIEKAKRVIEGTGVRVIETQNLSPQRVLLKLDVKDMREVVLRLTQNGFLNIEGYNATLA